jgi:hypothetical protein
MSKIESNYVTNNVTRWEVVIFSLCARNVRKIYSICPYLNLIRKTKLQKKLLFTSPP